MQRPHICCNAAASRMHAMKWRVHFVACGRMLQCSSRMHAVKWRVHFVAMRPHCGVRSRLSSESNEQQHAQCKGNATYVSHAKHIAACAGAPANSGPAWRENWSKLAWQALVWSQIGNAWQTLAEKSSFEKLENELKFHKIRMSRASIGERSNKSNKFAKLTEKKWQKRTYQRWNWIKFDDFSGLVDPLNATVSWSTYLCYRKTYCMMNTTRLYYRKKDFNQPFSIAPVRHLRCPEPTFEQNLRAKKRLRARARIALNGVA